MVTPITVDPEHVYFGFDGEKRRSFMFSKPIEGDRVDIFVTLTKVATGNGTAEQCVKKVLVKFADILDPMIVTPSPVVFTDGIAQTIVTTVTPQDSKSTMTDLKVAGSGESHGITVTVSGNQVTFSGTPTSPGTATFIFTATIDGKVKTMYYIVTIEENTDRTALTVAPTAVSGKAGSMLSQYVTVTTWPAGAILAGVTVKPTSWNGLTVTLDGNQILVSGTPTAAGTQTFEVYANVNGDPETASFTVTVTSDTPVPPTPVTEVFSPNSDNWDATYNTTTRAFMMSTPIEGMTAAEIDSIVAYFTNSAAVTGVEAKTVDGALVIRGTIVSGFNPVDVVINELKTSLKDGTVVDQTGLSIGLSEILARNRDDGSSSNCSTGFAGLALLMAIPLFFRKRG